MSFNIFWKHHKNKVYGAVIITVLFIGVANTLNALAYGEALWDTTSGVNRGTVNGVTFEVAKVDPNNLPVQVTEVSATLLGIDPDRTGIGAWDSGKDGPLPEVDSYIGQLAHVDKDGLATPYTEGYKLPDRGDGNEWRLDYYQISIGEFTRASQISGYLLGHGNIQDYECLEVQATFYIQIHVKTSYNEQPVSSEWGGGKIVYSQSGAIPNGYSGTGLAFLVEMPVLGGSYDAPGEANPTLGVNAEIGLFTVEGNSTDKIYIFAISGVLKPAVRYNYIGLTITSVHSMWDAGFIQNIRFSLAVSRPLILENRSVDTVAPPDRQRSELENPFDLGNIFSFLFYLFLGLVLLIVLWKVLPALINRKKSR